MIARIGLFLSAYSPLFFILALQNGLPLLVNSLKPAPIAVPLVFFSLFLLGVIAFILVVFCGKDDQPQKITVLGTHLSGGDAVGYLSGYLLPFISTTEFDARHVTAYIVFFWVACLVTVQTDVIQINPLFFLFGYRIYSTEATFRGITKGSKNRLSVILITRKKLAVGETVDTYELNEEVRLVP